MKLWTIVLWLLPLGANATWKQSEYTDKMTDKKTREISVVSIETSYKGQRSELSVECLKKDKQALLTVPDLFKPTSANVTCIQARFDKKTAKQRCGYLDSNNKTMAVTDNYSNSDRFIEDLKSKSKLLVRFDSILNETVDLEFDISGFNEAFKACNKK